MRLSLNLYELTNRGYIHMDLRKEALSQHKRALLEAWLRGERPIRLNATIAQRPPGAPRQLSFAQESLWSLRHEHTRRAIFNQWYFVRLRGMLDFDALQEAFRIMATRHEVFRTSFVERGDQVVIEVSPSAIPEVAVVQLTHLGREAAMMEASKRAADESRSPIELAYPPLARIRIFRLAEDDHLLTLFTHHMVFDAWSMGVVVRELNTLYSAALQQRAAALPSLPVSYSDFAHWERSTFKGETLAQMLNTVLSQLDSAPRAVGLPYDRPPQADGERDAVHHFALSLDTSRRARSFAREHSVSLFTTLIAAFAASIVGWGGNSDCILRTPLAGRNGETENLIGIFSNHIPLRIDVSGKPSFLELVARARAEFSRAYSQRALPYSLLRDEMRRSGAQRFPRLETGFVLQNVPIPTLALPGLTVEPLEVHFGRGLADLVMIIVESPVFVDAGQALAGQMHYRTAVFDASTIERLCLNYEQNLSRMLLEPSSPITRAFV